MKLINGLTFWDTSCFIRLNISQEAINSNACQAQNPLEDNKATQFQFLQNVTTNCNIIRSSGLKGHKYISFNRINKTINI